jgi:hypothetical protein
MTAAAETCYSSSCEATGRCTFNIGRSTLMGRSNPVFVRMHELPPSSPSFCPPPPGQDCVEINNEALAFVVADGFDLGLRRLCQFTDLYRQVLNAI